MIRSITKRDGRIVKYDSGKIRDAVIAGLKGSGVEEVGIMATVSQSCVDAVEVRFKDEQPTVEEIQDAIVEVFREMQLNKTADHFISYRRERNRVRELKSDVMKAVIRIGEETERDNANVGNNFSAKLLQIASVANKYANLASMPSKFSKAHESGVIHMHDLDSYNIATNCLQIALGEALEKGFNTGYGAIRTPKSIGSASALACILLQSSQNDCFGGQSFDNFDNDLSKYVGLTRDKEREELFASISRMVPDFIPFGDEFDERLKEILDDKVEQAMQAICYNLNTMHSRAGSQVPFSSINLGLPENDDAALVCEKFLKEYDKGMGKGEQLIFPNIIFRIKKGVNFYPNDPYRYLTDLAIKVSAHRMNPTFRFIDSKLNLPYYEKGIIAATMGCRTDILANINGPEGPAKRGNIAPVSMNIVRLAIDSRGNIDRFFKMLEETMELCDNQLMHRYDVLKKLKVKDLPFVAGEGLMLGSEGLEPDDSIEPILKQGTWGIGFIGLAETIYALIGKHHGQDDEAYELAKRIMNFMSDKIESFKQKRHLNYSLYATPAEGLSGRFTKIDQAKYGVIEGVTDKDYYTNSFHIPVAFPISATEKADKEAPFHLLCTAGHISYFEIDGGTIEERAEYINRHINYCVENTEISYVAYNFRVKYCKECGKGLKLEMNKCSKCGSSKLQGVSRVTGYMSLDERFTPGKTAERADRVIHSCDLF